MFSTNQITAQCVLFPMQALASFLSFTPLLIFNQGEGEGLVKGYSISMYSKMRRYQLYIYPNERAVNRLQQQGLSARPRLAITVCYSRCTDTHSKKVFSNTVLDVQKKRFWTPIWLEQTLLAIQCHDLGMCMMLSINFLQRMYIGFLLSIQPSS